MILLDTNIISEMMKPLPDAVVMKWIDQQEIVQLYVSAITIAEVGYGLNALPNGNRRYSLEHAFSKTIQKGFESRILNFDEPAAHMYGAIMSSKRKLGQPLGVPDGMIAAIAKVHNASVATRNVRDFADCGVQLINPFEER